MDVPALITSIAGLVAALGAALAIVRKGRADPADDTAPPDEPDRARPSREQEAVTLLKEMLVREAARSADLEDALAVCRQRCAVLAQRLHDLGADPRDTIREDPS